jgi:hypothetical protein
MVAEQRQSEVERRDSRAFPVFRGRGLEGKPAFLTRLGDWSSETSSGGWSGGSPAAGLGGPSEPRTYYSYKGQRLPAIEHLTTWVRISFFRSEEHIVGWFISDWDVSLPIELIRAINE